MDNGKGTGLPIAEAAAALGLSKAAVRKRVLRGTLPATKGQDGQWYVHVTAEDRVRTQYTTRDTPSPETRDSPSPDGREALIAQLQSENAFLRDQLGRVGEDSRRKDAIIAGFAGQLQALSATTSQVKDAIEVVAREARSVADPEPAATGDDAEPRRRASWWRRLLYGAGA